MSMYTRCPHCGTYFRVLREQLQASSGQVRCGRCQRVFDAFATLTSQLPAAPPETASPPVTAPAATPASARQEPEQAPVVVSPPDFSAAAAWPDASVEESALDDADESRSGQAEPEILTLPDDLFRPGALRAGGRPWPWIAGSGALAAALVVQGLFFFATELTVRFPEVRPVVSDACQWLGCMLALPRMPDQLFIEASDLQVLNAQRPSEVLLTISIRNRAAVTQDLPLIELTLTDTMNQATARKVFYPADYVDKAESVGRGIGANQEVALKLYLDTGDIKPSGYRLYLFFA